MKTSRRIALGIVLSIAIASGLTASGSAHADRSTKVAANKRLVLSFIRDVLNEHRGDHAARYLTKDMQWHGGTVGTVTGRENVAGLLSTVVTSLPDLRADVQDIFGQGDEVVVRLVVTGTQKGALLGIPATGRPVRWDAVDVYRLKHGKISQEWAAEDLTAVLADTGTYKAPWIQ
jgi:steroid delta-isomerase-like uncharacterized protein